jgi:hypothetical protein
VGSIGRCREHSSIGEKQSGSGCVLRHPACRHVRRLSRLRSGSPPCGGVWRPCSSVDLGHLRASRRPSWWLWRAFPRRASRGLPPLRMCPRKIEASATHSQGVARPTVASFLVHSGARDSRAARSTRRGAAAGGAPWGPRRGASRFAGGVSVAGMSLLLQRRLASPRAIRKTSFGSSAPVPVSPRHRPAVAFGACRASAPARRPAVACGVRGPRSVSATFGRLDGLLGGCGALFRGALPEDCHP